jgi:hypothetical protein
LGFEVRHHDFLTYGIGQEDLMRCPRVKSHDAFFMCTFVSFVVDEVQMLEPQRTRRCTKDLVALYASTPVRSMQMKFVPESGFPSNWSGFLFI